MFVVGTIVAEGFDFKCKVEDRYWLLVGHVEQCTAQNVSITSRDEEITSVNGRTEPMNLQYLDIERQTVHYLPKGIDKFFPNLKGLEVRHSKLMSLAQDDLKSLTQLKQITIERF